MRAVVADRRGLHQDTRFLAGPVDGGYYVIGAVNPAIADLSLDLGIPALGEKVMTSKIDNGVATVNLILPAAFGRGVALDDLIMPELGFAPDHVGVPR